MKKYEYIIIYISYMQFSNISPGTEVEGKFLKYMGEERWQLTSIVYCPAGSKDYPLYYFRRKI